MKQHNILDIKRQHVKVTLSILNQTLQLRSTGTPELIYHHFNSPPHPHQKKNLSITSSTARVRPIAN